MYAPARWLKEHYRQAWWLIFLISTLPGLLLLRRYLSDDLGINPLETLLHTTGRWALIFLIISLTITPLRRGFTRLSRHLHARYGKRLSDWNWIIRLRRMLGLYSFFYGLMHGLVYLFFDLALDWSWAIQDIREKPYILVGLATLLLLSLLAATSTDRMIRRLGRNWRRIHRLVYAIAILALLHFWWLSKVGVYDPLPYSIIIAALLAYRFLARYGVLIKPAHDDGMEVPERTARTHVVTGKRA
jgi:sulfoxide reductase heme-binding subunit YedZ